MTVLRRHLRDAHGITTEAYAQRHPGAPVLTAELSEHLRSAWAGGAPPLPPGEKRQARSLKLHPQTLSQIAALRERWQARSDAAVVERAVSEAAERG